MEEPNHDIDILYRAGWYDRETDYDHYRTLMWSDGHDDVLSRYEGESIVSFMGEGDAQSKHNFVAGSQEMVRNNDPAYTSKYLRATSRFPHTPLGSDDNNYSGHKVTGISVARNVEFEITETETEGDAYPEPGLMNVESAGDGIARIAYVYNDVENDENAEIPESARIMGVATTTLEKNSIVLGVDWRHFSNLDYVLRGVFDFIQNNGGEVVPVELLSFEAEAAGSRVDLMWKTASEHGSDRFEIEKAEMNEAGTSDFSRIAEVEAAGNSSVVKNYGPVVDTDVKMGGSYIYRLKMVDVDGEYEYSEEKVVTLDGEGISEMEELMPNPVSSSTQLRYNLAGSGDVTVKVIDMSGDEVLSLPQGMQNAGSHTVEIPASDLSSGSYRVVLSSGSTMKSTMMNVVK
jgi:hypothetical protein